MAEWRGYREIFLAYWPAARGRPVTRLHGFAIRNVRPPLWSMQRRGLRSVC